VTEVIDAIRHVDAAPVNGPTLGCGWVRGKQRRVSVCVHACVSIDAVRAPVNGPSLG
jgi:hypothetical protein